MATKRATAATMGTEAEGASIKGTGKVDIRIKAPNFQTAMFEIVGTAPYVQNRFSSKARDQMKAKQEAGSTGTKSKKVREAKDFDECYRLAIHKTKEGWFGMPAPAFRNAMISACRTVGFAMTLAKLSLFVEADGVDETDGTPLVRITRGSPHPFEASVRNESGVCDIRVRPMWDPGWRSRVRVRFDGDQFTLVDVTNLMMRVGMQVGIGEGRPDSKKSCGMNWGLFELADEPCIRPSAMLQNKARSMRERPERASLFKMN